MMTKENSAPMFDNGFAVLYQADARQLPIPDESVDCVVTSPPYWGLRNYQIDNGIGLEPTPEEYCANMVAVFREVWRVLRPTGTVWMNLGDSYSGGGSGQNFMESASRNVSVGTTKEQGGFGHIKTHRNPSSIGLKPKDLVGIPWRVAFALQADGWYLRSDIIWSKLNPMPEPVQDRPTKAHEYVFLLTKSSRYYYDADAIRETHIDWERGAHGEWVGSGDDERPQLGVRTGTFNAKDRNGAKRAYNSSGRNKRSVWEISTHPYPEAHFATFPEKLVEPCIMAGCPQDGVVLDPFVGSGTTLAVAQRLGRKGIGTDLNAEYLKLASDRITGIPLPMMLV